MKRWWLAAICAVLVLAVIGVALVQRGDEAQAQGARTPVLVLEVASWDASGADPGAWEWQALDDSTLHIVFFAPGEMTCAEITLPAGVTATYADAEGVVATLAGPADAVAMCEAVFTRANG